MNKIYVLIGAPAFGKSVMARKMHEEDPAKVIVSRDEIRASRGKYWIEEQEDYISDIEEFEIRSAIKHGLSPIIDATNLNLKTMDKWEKLSVELGVDLEKIFLPYIPFAEALARDIKRGQEGGRAVGEKTLRSFYKRYYWDQYEKEVFGNKHPSSDPDDSLPPAVIFDLDFTIMYRQNRGPFEYAKADTDKVDPKAKWMIQRWIDDGINVILLTGRDATEDSINAIRKALGIPQKEKMDGKYFPYEIIGRNEGDRRSSVIVKKELYEKEVEGKYNVLMAFDDDQEVVDMYKSKGIFASKV
jgi:predicted kinase